jgi:hypothetical protein
MMEAVKKAFFFDPDTFARAAEEYREDFLTAKPFPHIVIDGLFPEDLLEEVIDEVPTPEEWATHPEWRKADRADAKKLMVNRTWMLGPVTRHLLNEFNAAVFINFLEELTQINGLVPDPHYFGGGIHQIEAGGFLKIHADFNIHQRINLDRRLNALLYLNRDWDDQWGGHLELWDKQMQNRVKAIAPVFNRMVIFTTTDTTFHGHPDPLACPPGVTRRSLALYYYTNGRPEEEQSASHSTLHQVRPGEDFDPTPQGQKAKEAEDPKYPEISWRDFIPPVATKLKAYANQKKPTTH